jgi:hypothetical protein
MNRSRTPRKATKKKQKSVVHLQAFGADGTRILSESMSFADYYDKGNELIDSSSFRSARSVVKVHGEVYNSKGVLVEDFWNEYSITGERTGGTVTYEDGATYRD